MHANNLLCISGAGSVIARKKKFANNCATEPIASNKTQLPLFVILLL